MTEPIHVVAPYHIADGCSVADSVMIAPGVVIGSEGFGYEKDTNGLWQHRDHPYGVVIEDDVQIGANTVIDRGRWRDTHIGYGTKIDAHVFIAHNVRIGARTLVIAGTSIGGSCNIGNDCWLGIGCTIKDNIDIPDWTMIGAGAVVVKSIEKPGGIWVGNPAKFLRMNDGY